MAGSAIKLTTRDRGVLRAMERLAFKGGDIVQAALKNIGEQLLKSTRKRFDQQKDPSGKAWAALNPEYKAGKKGTKILQASGMRGGLLGTIVYKVTGNRLELGTNKVYAAIHQFGGVIRPRDANALFFRLNGKLVLAKKVTIPARPFLGISDSDKAEIAAVVEDHVNEVWQNLP